MSEAHVWYACYGSNMWRERFMCYIQGGTAPGSLAPEAGCTDSTPPTDDRPITLPFQLYFRKRAVKWDNLGVAFIGHVPSASHETLGRMYRISREQFTQVVQQENKMPDMEIDFDLVMREGAANISDGWYGRIVYLGEEGDDPVFTFTTPDPIDDLTDFVCPSESYLQTLIRGYREIYGMKASDIVEILHPKPGIFESMSADELLEIVERAL